MIFVAFLVSAAVALGTAGIGTPAAVVGYRGQIVVGEEGLQPSLHLSSCAGKLSHYRSLAVVNEVRTMFIIPLILFLCPRAISIVDGLR
jgi:hypothetical protein